MDNFDGDRPNVLRGQTYILKGAVLENLPRSVPCKLGTNFNSTSEVNLRLNRVFWMSMDFYYVQYCVLCCLEARLGQPNHRARNILGHFITITTTKTQKKCSNAISVQITHTQVFLVPAIVVYHYGLAVITHMSTGGVLAYS